jgi:bacterioferritin-associated ferredoxin
MNHYQSFIRQHPEHAEELEERAAIMEYCGERSREAAEMEAMWLLKDKYCLWGK